MFRRLQSVISPMSAMRIDSANESDLQTKLHLTTEYLVNSTKQFDSWMQLQIQNRLHYCLRQIYEKGQQGQAREQDLVSIFQFYTLLIINCKDQLLICKLVSDDFVIEMCQLYKLPAHLASELEAYRINLIKAYMGTITPEIVKYMVVQDKFKVFYTCVRLYSGKMGTGTVQLTTIANSLLNVMKKVDQIPYLWESVWVPQGLQLLLTQCLSFIQEHLSGIKKNKSMQQIVIQIKQQVRQQPKQLQQKQDQHREQQTINNQSKQINKQEQNQQNSNDENKQMTEQIQVDGAAQNKKQDNQNSKEKQEQKDEEQNDHQEKQKQQRVNQQDKADSMKNTEQQKQKEQQRTEQQISKDAVEQQAAHQNMHEDDQQQEQEFSKQPQQQSHKQLDLNEEQIQLLYEHVLFTIELISSISSPDVLKQIYEYCYMYLQEILEAMNGYKTYRSKVYSYSILFNLFRSYSFEQESVESFMASWFNEVLLFIGQSNLFNEEPKEKEQQKEKAQSNNEHGHLQINQLMCRSMYILCKVISSRYSLLSERVLDQALLDKDKILSIKQVREQIMEILVNRIQSCMDHLEATEPDLLMQFIKNMLLTAFQLKVVMGMTGKGSNLEHNNHAMLPMANYFNLDENEKQKQLSYRLDQSILELFLSYTSEFKKLMYKNQLWANIIKWYEEGTNQVTHSLLSLPDNFERVAEDRSYIIMLTYEYIKNYRYMIVEYTTLDPKAIKQEKFYHSTFSSPGLSYEPGKTINQIVHIVCPCLLHHNYQQIPVVVIQDKQCFIIAMKLNANQHKVLINIKFKDIEGFVYGSTQSAEGWSNHQMPKFIKINLRGSQQIILEFNNPKVVGNAFKDYLIKNRDVTRQRQLTFLNAWAKDYQVDTEKSLDIVKEKLNKKQNIQI